MAGKKWLPKLIDKITPCLTQPLNPRWPTLVSVSRPLCRILGKTAFCPRTKECRKNSCDLAQRQKYRHKSISVCSSFDRDTRNFGYGLEGHKTGDELHGPK